MNRRVSHLIAGWRTGLSRPVLILQAGNAVNYFGYGLVLPFEIIYLHQIRGFSTATAGLVLAATMGTSSIVTPPTGALLDQYSAKAPASPSSSIPGRPLPARSSREPGSAPQGRPTEHWSSG
jgi:hypothetical protein